MDFKKLLKNIKGLKFPDAYIIKFFFKENLYKKKGSVIEFGCGNGNNLYLFKSYGYETVGIDINEINIKNANDNFKLLFGSQDNKHRFLKEDIRNINNIINNLKHMKFEIFLLPNVIYYIKKEDFKNILKHIPIILSKNGKIFVRFRSPRDMRVGMGEPIGNNEYIIKEKITGEYKAILSVYEEYEMIDILRRYLNIDNYKIFHIYEENYHTDRKVLNADIIIWGDFNL